MIKIMCNSGLKCDPAPYRCTSPYQTFNNYFSEVMLRFLGPEKIENFYDYFPPPPKKIPVESIFYKTFKAHQDEIEKAILESAGIGSGQAMMSTTGTPWYQQPVNRVPHRYRIISWSDRILETLIVEGVNGTGLTWVETLETIERHQEEYENYQQFFTVDYTTSDIKPEKTPCFHKWKMYTGLSERFEYCEKCDIKKT